MISKETHNKILATFSDCLLGVGMFSSAFFAVCLMLLSRRFSASSVVACFKTKTRDQIELELAANPQALDIERECVLIMLDLISLRGVDKLLCLEPFARVIDQHQLLDDDRKQLLDGVLDIARQRGDTTSPLHNGMQHPAVLQLSTWLLKGYKEHGNVYNPYAGTGELAIHFGSDYHYVATEEDKYVAFMGKMNMFFCHVYDRGGEFYCANPLKEWRGSHQELVVMNPPWGTKDEMDRLIDVEAMKLGILSLNPAGVLLSILPTNSLKFVCVERSPLEEWLRTANLLDTMVSLPRGVMTHSVAPATIIIARKGRADNDPIRMLDAKQFCETEDGRVVLNFDDIRRAMELKSPGIYMEMTVSELAKRDFVLSPEYHIALSTVRLGRRTVIVRDIATVLALETVADSDAPLVVSDMLNDNPYQKPLERHSLANSSKTHAQNRARLQQTAILLAVNGALRPTICNATPAEPVDINTDEIMALAVDPAQVDINFMAYEISVAPDVRNSVELSQKDVEHLVMYIPESLSVQQQIFEESRRATQEAIRRDQTLEERIEERINDYKLLERTRRHNISSYIANTSMGYLYLQNELRRFNEQIGKIDGGIRKLLAHVKELGLADSQPVASFISSLSQQQQDANDTICNISNSVVILNDQFAVIRDMIKRFGSDEAFGEATVLSLDRMLTEHTKNNSDHNRFTIELRKDLAAFARKEVFVKTSEFDFLQLFDNIVGNAYRHAFGMQDSKSNRIRISWHPTANNRNVEINFENNGLPLPDNINKETYGLEGETAGRYANTGHGGNYVKQFVEHFNGDYDVVRGSRSAEFQTTIKITLPIVKLS